jgi:hypothetical protein
MYTNHIRKLFKHLILLQYTIFLQIKKFYINFMDKFKNT